MHVFELGYALVYIAVRVRNLWIQVRTVSGDNNLWHLLSSAQEGMSDMIVEPSKAKILSNTSQQILISSEEVYSYSRVSI